MSAHGFHPGNLHRAPKTRALSIPLRSPRSTAERLLDAARAANPGRSFGHVRHERAALGEVLVTWNRVDRVYDVGTEARSVATGRRSDVLPALEKLIGGAS